MDVQDGFIVGIFNYCDTWCATCAFTSHCRVFADLAEAEAALDPHLQAIVDAPQLPEEIPPPPPRWMQELMRDIDEATDETISNDQWKGLHPSIAPEHQAIEARAHVYLNRVHTWLVMRECREIDHPTDPQAVVAWFHTLIAAKIHRALMGRARDLDDLDSLPDHDGSAKVALVGIERSHAAWLGLVDKGLVSGMDSAAFIADLVWLGNEVERAFPRARAFVRPAFDEPDAVARMQATAWEQ